MSSAWFLHTYRLESRPKSSILVSSDQRILFVTILESFRYFLANFHVSCTEERLPSGHSAIKPRLVEGCSDGWLSTTFSHLPNASLELSHSDLWVLLYLSHQMMDDGWMDRMSFICHIHNYTEYNEEWNVFSAFNPSKCTHLEQWAADSAAPGEQSWTSCRSRDSNPQPWVTSGLKSNALTIRPTTAHQGSSPPIAQFGRTASSRKDSGRPKRLPFKDYGGHCALRNLKCSRIFFVTLARSVPCHNSVSELFRQFL